WLAVRGINQGFQTLELGLLALSFAFPAGFPQSAGQCKASVGTSGSEFDRGLQFLQRAVDFSSFRAQPAIRYTRYEVVRRQLDSLFRIVQTLLVIDRAEKLKSDLDARRCV